MKAAFWRPMKESEERKQQVERYLCPRCKFEIKKKGRYYCTAYRCQITKPKSECFRFTEKRVNKL